MALNTRAIITAAESHALRLGRFERVNRHEPKNPPGNGLTAAIWIQRIRPHAKRSGLAKTSAALVLSVRIYTSMLSEPQDEIDPNVADAADELMGAYSGDFDLGGAAANVDLLGETGIQLEAEAGYINQAGKLQRVMTVTVPVIVNDAWEQVA